MIHLDTNLLIGVSDTSNAHHAQARRLLALPAPFAASAVAWTEYQSRLLTTDFHLYRGGVATHWRQIAERVERDPLSLEGALGNIDRWLAKERLHPAPLLEWRHRIHHAQSTAEGMRELLAFLRADNADAEPPQILFPFRRPLPCHFPRMNSLALQHIVEAAQPEAKPTALYLT